MRKPITSLNRLAGFTSSASASPCATWRQLLISEMKRTAARTQSPEARKGVALIITLIMLAVITFMATTFLVLSRRERNAVTTTTDQTTARFAADTGLEQAKFALMTGIFGTNVFGIIGDTSDDQNFDLMKSEQR